MLEDRIEETLCLCELLDHAITERLDAEENLFAYAAETAPWSFNESVVDALELRIATLHDSAAHWSELIDASIACTMAGAIRAGI